MRIGIPKEVKILEGRVALVPAAIAEVVAQGHRVRVQTGAGHASGYSDADYEAAGAELAPDAGSLYDGAEVIVKVKEPVAEEYELLRADHILFSYLHLAAEPELAKHLCDRGLTAVAFETIEVGGRLPLLAPMSEVAGRIAVQVGATLLYQPHGGRGVLLGGASGTDKGRVVILGAGSAGGHAARVAVALGAELTVFARSPSSHARMRALGPAVVTAVPDEAILAAAVSEADLLVGAVLVPGARAVKLVSEEMVKSMRPGAVIVDISVDQGGCIATTRPTSYAQPTFIKHGVTHFCVTNMPGAVPRTASQALSKVLTPYLLRLAKPNGLKDPAIKTGINVHKGRILHPAVAAALV